MKYSNLKPEQHESLGGAIDTSWENAYAILNTDKWKVPESRPPLCIKNQDCKVCPEPTSGYPLSLKKWDDSRKISHMNINKKSGRRTRN